SAAERTAAAIARIEKLDPLINAVIAIDPTAMAQARAIDAGARGGILAGMPILLKDNIEARGPLPTTAGSLALIDNVTGRDAPLVANLRAAGAIILGKANLSEWANIRDDDSISGWSAVGGQTRNPHILDRNGCGSSTGSAAAVAAGYVPAAIGTETDGSVTCPAAATGVVGFKPTVGLVSRTHVVPISISQDSAGPISREVMTAARVLSAMAGSDPADPATAEADARKANYHEELSERALEGRRIGVMRFASGFHTDEAFEEALETLKAEGAILVDIDEGPGRGDFGGDEFTVLLTELKAGLNAYLASTDPERVKTRTLADLIAFNREHAALEMPLFDQTFFEMAEETRGLDDAGYRAARERSLAATGAEGIDRLLAEHDVVALVGPTMPPAWLIDPVLGDQISGGGAGGLAAVAGYPHLTVPMGTVDELPVGLSFIGPRWSDALILSLGHDYEQASRKRVEPRFLKSVSELPEIERALEPALRSQP
ncbi:MAG: amidase, partial [Sphingomonadaceae bacterium]